MTCAETSRPEDTRFELYKNSRFEACAARPVQNLDCAALFDTMKHHPDSKGDNSPGNHTTLIYGFNRTHWCDNAWCFRDFKVVPSAIPSRVLLHGRLLQWWFIGETALFTVYHFKSQAFFDAHTPSQCKNKGIGMKLSLFLSLASLAWWWTDFGLILAQGSLPISFTTLSMFSWAVTWRTAHSFHLHPLRCAFHAWRRNRRLSMAVLYAITLFQLGATVHMLSQIWVLPFSSYYQCLEQKVAAAPGATSICSPAEMCRLPFGYLGYDKTLEYAALCVFGSAILPEGLIRVLGLVPGDRRDHGIIVRVFYLARVLALLAICATAASWETITTSQLSRSANREAQIVADLRCRVVHVGLSDWRYFLDIDWNRGLGMARALFNVGF
ncbi:hypothetical protein IF1G_08732 [Cordyceps javanica]|uniref:Uncharacterized protein n=1 Tax=Cordyceps javanica TaxID=43265 RepID=A0A545UTK7_9HYPO|nr:hypothetical protein IF1G_08732 [Cordyceps javanica]